MREGHEVGAISIITLIEILRVLEAGKRAKVKELLEEGFNVQGLDNEIIETYCNLYPKLRKEGVSMPDADLLIAATAISRNMSLKTEDEHFERLKELGLKLVRAPKNREKLRFIISWFSMHVCDNDAFKSKLTFLVDACENVEFK